jgi:TPR repeat protein
VLLSICPHQDSFGLVQRAAAQGHREGLFRLGMFTLDGVGCTRDAAKAAELIRRAAELQQGDAQYRHGLLAYGGLDWRRYVWWGRASLGGCNERAFYFAVVALVPAFEEGKHVRILHTVAPVVRKGLDATRTTASRCIQAEEVEELCRVMELHEELLGRARRAIACWSVVGQRVGVAKDMRMTIAKLAWDEAWRWGEAAPA